MLFDQLPDTESFLWDLNLFRFVEDHAFANEPVQPLKYDHFERRFIIELTVSYALYQETMLGGFAFCQCIFITCPKWELTNIRGHWVK